MVNQYTHIGHWSYMVNQYTHIVHWSVSSPIRAEPARYVTKDFQNKGANNTTAASNGERSTENRISLTSPKLYRHRGGCLTAAAHTHVRVPSDYATGEGEELGSSALGP
jgi:hypothetical protein